ncbi:ferredoxin [Agromyces ramosus]|uniref:Ferredoxin n=1 Tax=Agromyces ramosus TaxID=33879 RepID=A0ABU0RDG1_9MICO|nr:ferredoxin [Agromyces ramosus]MDQ0896120.1 ferredoxin [Agromyces ramosus]
MLVAIPKCNCSRTVPSVFANLDENDGFVSVLDENPPQSEWAMVREAEDLCPSATIHIEKDDDSSGS